MSNRGKIQEAIDTTIFPDIALSIEERRYQAKAVATLKQAARKYADPLDELWWCENHGYRIDRFEGVTPENCLYEGRPGDCKPIAALIVRGITEAPDGR